MYNFFKMAHSVADSDPREFNSIKDLTIQLAMEAGYHRDFVTLKNGNKVLKTLYNTKDESGNSKCPWSDVLVAKWFCYFEKLFKAKLLPHPEISEYYSFILQRTFSIYINALQIPMLASDAVVVRGVNLCLANRIGEVFILIGSKSRADKYEQLKIQRKSSNEEERLAALKTKNRINMKTSFDHQMTSLDQLLENKYIDTDNYTPLQATETDDIYLGLKIKLEHNPFGLRLLNALVYCNGHFNIKKINDYIALSAEESANPATLMYIKEGYLTILDYLSYATDNAQYKDKLRKLYTKLDTSAARAKFSYNNNTLKKVDEECAFSY